MIFAKAQYKTHDNELLAIVEAFQSWQYCLKDCKHKVLVLTNYNNLCQFMDTKNLSSRQVRWAQKLFCYYLQINYYQGKANGAANALSQYLQRNAKEEENLCAKNIKILHRLQSSLAKVSRLSTNHLSSFYWVFIYETTIFL